MTDIPEDVLDEVEQALTQTYAGHFRVVLAAMKEAAKP